MYIDTDCGAGIGRVSKRLLLPLFKEVDLEEPNSAFLEKIQGYLVSRNLFSYMYVHVIDHFCHSVFSQLA